MSENLFDRVALIGIGLIGSSLARVLRRDSPGTRLVACARLRGYHETADGNVQFRDQHRPVE